MIVRLTSRQYHAVMGCLSPEIISFLNPPHEIEGPVDWREIPDFFLWLVNSYIKTLDHGASANASMGNAMRRIITEVGNYRTHPAFSGVGMIGEQSTVLTGWVCENQISPFLAEAHPAAEFVVLYPVFVERVKVRVTIWTGESGFALTDPVLSEARHRSFAALTDQHSALKQNP